jgi:hypothetical protein
MTLASGTRLGHYGVADGQVEPVGIEVAPEARASADPSGPG